MYTYCTSPQVFFFFFFPNIIHINYRTIWKSYRREQCRGGEEEGGAPVPRDWTQELTQQACREQETPGSDGLVYPNWRGTRMVGDWSRNRLFPLKPKVNMQEGGFLWFVLIQETGLFFHPFVDAWVFCFSSQNWSRCDKCISPFTLQYSSLHSQIGPLMFHTPERDKWCTFPLLRLRAKPVMLGWNYSQAVNVHWYYYIIITLKSTANTIQCEVCALHLEWLFLIMHISRCASTN